VTTDFKKLIQERAGEHGESFQDMYEQSGAEWSFEKGATEFVQLALESEEVMAMREAIEELVEINGLSDETNLHKALANFDKLLQSLKEGKSE